jgi:DegV family protein with EDD domain
MSEIKIFADSACDLDLDYLDELGVTMIPLTVHFENEAFRDRVDITTTEFYDRLRKFSGFPISSQINPGMFVTEFKKELDKGKHIICINFSSKLSGTYQSACMAKEMLSTDRLDVVDTKAASVGCGLIVREAALMAKSGKSGEEILERVNFMSEKMEHIFAVGHLDMLKRGGRISTAQAVVGTLLNVKPILQFDNGMIVPYDKVRGEKAVIKKLIDTMKERGDIETQSVIGLNYSETNKLCLELKSEIEKNFGKKEFVISEIGAAIGVHVGGGTISVFFLKR